MSEDIKNIKKNTVSGIFWKLGERVTAQLISFVVSIILARLLFPEQYGIVAIVSIFINIANTLVSNGLGTSLVQSKEAGDIEFSTMFWSNMFFSMVLYLFLFITAPIIGKVYNNELLVPVLRVMGIRLPIAAFNSIQHAYVQRKMIYRKFFFATIGGTIISAVVGILMAMRGFGVWALVAQYLTNSTIDTIVMFLTIKWKPKLMFSYEKFKKLFGYGWRITVAALVGILFSSLRGLIIGIKYTSADLAYNNKGEQIPTMFSNNIDIALDTVLFSSISRFQDDKIKMKSAVSRLMQTSSYLITPAMLGIAAVATSITKIILTDKWLPSVPYMRVVCIVHAFSMLSTVNLQAIKAIGRSDVCLKLEFYKKPFYILMILITMFISPFAICVGNACYAVVAITVNSKPNKELLNYSLLDQIKDISLNLISSVIMMVIVLLVGKININIYLLTVLQVIVGVLTYLMLSIGLKNKSFYYVRDSIIQYLKDRRKEIQQ